MEGLEPPRLSALDPKSSAATNYATSALLYVFLFRIFFNFRYNKYRLSPKYPNWRRKFKIY